MLFTIHQHYLALTVTGPPRKILSGSATGPSCYIYIISALDWLILLFVLLQFFDLLIEINATIEAYFNASGVNVLELRERVDTALEKAERAK